MEFHKEPKTISIKHVTVKYRQTFNGKRKANFCTIKWHSPSSKKKAIKGSTVCMSSVRTGCPRSYTADVELPRSSLQVQCDAHWYELLDPMPEQSHLPRTLLVGEEMAEGLWRRLLSSPFHCKSECNKVQV